MEWEGRSAPKGLGCGCKWLTWIGLVQALLLDSRQAKPTTALGRLWFRACVALSVRRPALPKHSA